MTISGHRLFRLFLRMFALGNGILAVTVYLIKSPSFATPLFEFPLLASLHAMVLGSLLPLLLDRYYQPLVPYRLGGLAICVGEVVMVTGFLLHPRSGLEADGGLLVMVGLLMAGVTFKVDSFLFLYWTALIMSASMGYVLGGVLMRPVIDPIPFSMIAAHGLLGVGLGLYPLFWIRSREKRGTLWAYLLGACSGGCLLWVLGKTMVTESMELFAFSILGLASIGIGWRGRILSFFFLLLAGLLVWSGRFLPGEWISTWGILQVFGSYAGYYLNKSGVYGVPDSGGTETV